MAWEFQEDGCHDDDFYISGNIISQCSATGMARAGLECLCGIRGELSRPYKA